MPIAAGSGLRVAVNISGPSAVSTLEIVKLVTELAGKDLAPEHIEPDPTKVQLTSGGAWRIDHRQAERIIGWRPQVEMKDGIRRLIAWREESETTT